MQEDTDPLFRVEGHEDADALRLLLWRSPVLWPLSFLLRPAWTRALLDAVLEFAVSDLPLEEYLFGNAFAHRCSTASPPLLTCRAPSAAGSADLEAAVPSPSVPRARTRPPSGRVWRRLFKTARSWTGYTFAILSFLWCFNNVGYLPFPSALSPVFYALQLDQSWEMFSPPPTIVYYHNIELILENGTHAELISANGLFRWQAGPLTGLPPEPLYPNYGNHRNWKFWESYNWHPANPEIRLEFGRWVCREWNSRHTGDQRVKRHITYYYWYPVPEPGEVPKPYREVMWDHYCMPLSFSLTHTLSLLNSLTPS